MFENGFNWRDFVRLIITILTALVTSLTASSCMRAHKARKLAGDAPQTRTELCQRCQHGTGQLFPRDAHCDCTCHVALPRVHAGKRNR